MPARRPAPSSLSLTGKLLQRVVRACCARPALTVSLGVVLAALARRRLRGTFPDARDVQIPPAPLHQRYASLYKTHAEDFAQLEDIVVVVQSPAVETSMAYAARLAGALRDGGLGTARVSYRIDASHLEERALLYLPLDTLRDMLGTVAGQEDLLADFAATPTVDRLVHGINQYVRAMFLPAALGPGAADKANPAPARLLLDLLTQMSEQIDGRPYRSPWGSVIAAPAGAPNGGCFLSHDRRLLYVVIDLADAPRTFAAEHAAVVAIRRAIESLRPQFPSVEAGVTGAPALFSDELSAAARDGRIASVLALILTLGLLLLAFRRLVTSCAMLAALALSLGWSLGVITLLVGHLTIFSLMFVSVVIGLGTDYGIYFLFRYREERVLGSTLVGALRRQGAAERRDVIGPEVDCRDQLRRDPEGRKLEHSEASGRRHDKTVILALDLLRHGLLSARRCPDSLYEAVGRPNLARGSTQESAPHPRFHNADNSVSTMHAVSTAGSVRLNFRNMPRRAFTPSTLPNRTALVAAAPLKPTKYSAGFGSSERSIRMTTVSPGDSTPTLPRLTVALGLDLGPPYIPSYLTLPNASATSASKHRHQRPVVVVEVSLSGATGRACG